MKVEAIQLVDYDTFDYELKNVIKAFINENTKVNNIA